MHRYLRLCGAGGRSARGSDRREDNLVLQEIKIRAAGKRTQPFLFGLRKTSRPIFLWGGGVAEELSKTGGRTKIYAN